MKVRRTFTVPDTPKGAKWYAECAVTGAMFESNDYVRLLQSIAEQPFECWEIGYIAPPLTIEEEVASAKAAHEAFMAKFPEEVRKFLP